MSETLHSLRDFAVIRTQHREARPRPIVVAVPAALLLLAAVWGMLRDQEPFVSFFYIWAWYPTLALLDCAVAARTGRYYMFDRPRFALSLLGWSAVLWFFFELINFRVQNWYYVFLPESRTVRWIGTTVSFATVLPAIFLGMKFLENMGIFTRDRWPGFEVRPGLMRGIFVAGLAFFALSLAWPAQFFPLIWGAVTLVLEPWNYRRDPARSLIGDLAAGRPGRLLRLLTAGLAIGFIWELYNIEAWAKWIYTVPGFENLRIFEMPVLGFLGFPVFALDCFVVYQTLVLLGVAVSGETVPSVNPGRGRTAVAVAIASVFSLIALAGMDRWTTDSLRPGMDDFFAANSQQRELLAQRFKSMTELARSEPQGIAEVARVDIKTATQWRKSAELIVFRGLGTENVQLLLDRGITDLEQLARADPGELSLALRSRSLEPNAATPIKVRGWVSAARRAVSRGAL